MNAAENELELKARAAKAASRKLACLSTEIKNKALLNIADELPIPTAPQREPQLAAAFGMDAEGER